MENHFNREALPGGSAFVCKHVCLVSQPPERQLYRSALSAEGPLVYDSVPSAPADGLYNEIIRFYSGIEPWFFKFQQSPRAPEQVTMYYALL